MDSHSTFAISSAGMALERARVEVAALNLANANSTAAAGQTPFAPLRVVAQAGSPEAFANLLQAGDVDAASARLPAFRVEPSLAQPRKVLEPGHPLADAQGFVSYPGVDTATEMMTMMGATRAYEANVAAMNAARTLALKALDIGGNS
jgi:flagellar basal-body rod protein FlgC